MRKALPYILTSLAIVSMLVGGFLMVYFYLAAGNIYHDSPNIALYAAIATISFLLLCGGGFVLTLFFLKKCNRIYLIIYFILSSICSLISLGFASYGIYYYSRSIEYFWVLIALLLLFVLAFMFLFGPIKALKRKPTKE